MLWTLRISQALCGFRVFAMPVLAGQDQVALISPKTPTLSCDRATTLLVVKDRMQRFQDLDHVTRIA